MTLYSMSLADLNSSYGMGFDAALSYGYIMAETVKKEI